MNEDPVLEFVTPLPLEKCVRRLEARHEKMSWFAWDWQRRTWIGIRQEDPGTYRFTMKRVDRNSFFAQGSLVVVSGYLRRLDADHTLVLAETRVVYFWLLMPVVALIGMLAAIALVDDPTTTPSDVHLITVIVVVFGLIWLLMSWWRIGAQMRELVGTLKEAVAGDMFTG